MQICSMIYLSVLEGFASQHSKLIFIQWGWGITGQRITGQSCSDWLKIMSSRNSKLDTGGLSLNEKDQINHFPQDIYL